MNDIIIGQFEVPKAPKHVAFVLLSVKATPLTLRKRVSQQLEICKLKNSILWCLDLILGGFFGISLYFF